MKIHYLYRCYDANDVLLYVGETWNMMERFNAHANDKPWWNDVARFELTMFKGRASAKDAEVQAIRSEHPKYNIRNAQVKVTDAYAEVARLPTPDQGIYDEVTGNQVTTGLLPYVSDSLREDVDARAREYARNARWLRRGGWDVLEDSWLYAKAKLVTGYWLPLDDRPGKIWVTGNKTTVTKYVKDHWKSLGN